MKIKVIVLAVVMVCITVIYVFHTGVNFSACNVDAGGFKAERIELVIPASKPVKHPSECRVQTVKKKRKV